MRRNAGWMTSIGFGLLLVFVLARPATSDLKGGMYGFEEPPPFKTVVSARDWLNRIQAKGWYLKTDVVLIETDAGDKRLVPVAALSHDQVTGQLLFIRR